MKYCKDKNCQNGACEYHRSMNHSCGSGSGQKVYVSNITMNNLIKEIKDLILLTTLYEGEIKLIVRHVKKRMLDSLPEEKELIGHENPLFVFINSNNEGYNKALSDIKQKWEINDKI
jgi:hypothetical protein